MLTTLPPPVRAVVDAAARLGQSVDGVAAVGLVGSYARGAAGPSSDVDLVVLCDPPEVLLDQREWWQIFDPRADLIRANNFGAIQERRLRLSRGLVVEVGVGHRSWASLNPVDPGTREVVRDGLLAVHDPDQLLERLLLAVAVR